MKYINVKNVNENIKKKRSHHVLESGLEVAQEGFGLVSLHLAVLDWFAPEEVVHLDREDGRRAPLILAAQITCTRGKTRVVHHINQSPLFRLSTSTQSVTFCVLDEFSRSGGR